MPVQSKSEGLRIKEAHGVTLEPRGFASPGIQKLENQKI
jgi:hypothetical protein